MFPLRLVWCFVPCASSCCSLTIGSRNRVVKVVHPFVFCYRELHSRENYYLAQELSRMAIRSKEFSSCERNIGFM